MGDLDGQLAVVTGGGRGQGRSHAINLAQAGADVVVCDIAAPIATARYSMATPEDLAETVALVEKTGRRGLAVQADVRKFSDLQGVAAVAVAEFGRIDILVANAGIMTMSRLEDIDDDTWQETIDVNLTGVANSIRAVLPAMVSQNYGRIVATASGAGRAGYPNLPHYSASKWGIIGLIKTVAREMAKNGITANAISPTMVGTPMLLNDASYEAFRPDLEHPTLEDCLDRFTSTNVIPVPWIESQDVSDALLFLVGPRSKFITGVALDVAAGLNAANSA